MKEDILGYQVDALSVSDSVNDIFSRISTSGASGGGCKWLACLNPHSYTVALDDEEFSSALVDADWLIPDGAGVVLASRILQGAIEQRVTGSDIFYGLLQKMNCVGGFSVFFLGATEETLGIVRNRFSEDYPNIRLAGTYSPPFKDSYSDNELGAMIDAVNSVSADVLWVGMTAPKQEKWIFENKDRLHVKFAAAIGAVFDFYSGRVVRSPALFQRVGLEWLPRLVQQPRRLWRRMGISAPVFVFHVFRQLIANKKSSCK